MVDYVIQNLELCNRMKALADKAMSLMKPDLKEAWDIRTMILQKNKPFLPTLLSTFKPNFQLLIGTYQYYHIEKLPEFISCKESMESDSIVSKYINRYIGTLRGLHLTWTSGHIYHILEKLLQDYFYNQKDNPELFDSLYKDFEKMCYDGLLPIRDIAPLHNFYNTDLKERITFEELIALGLKAFELKPVELEKNLRIKQITKEEYRELFGLRDVTDLRLVEVGEPNFTIECEVNEPVLGLPRFYIQDLYKKYPSEVIIDAVLTALRLFRPQYVGISNIFPFKDLDVKVELRYRPKNIIHEEQFGEKYSVTNNDLREFKNFWNTYGKALKDVYENQNRKELVNALDHFNSSYNRANDRDRIIDLSVSVEALFKSKERIMGTLSHTYSLRMSRMIGKSLEERKLIYSKMKNLHEERGGAVHASSNDKFDYKSLAEYVRLAIKEYLNRIIEDKSITHQQIIDSLEFG